MHLTSDYRLSWSPQEMKYRGNMKYINVYP